MIYDYERSYFGCCSSGAIAQHTRNTYRKTHTVSHYCHCHKLWENMLTVYLMGCRYCNEIRLKLFYLFFLHLSTAVIVMASSDDFLSFYSIYFKRQVKRRHEYSSIKLFSFDFEMKTKIAIHLLCLYFKSNWADVFFPSEKLLFVWTQAKFCWFKSLYFRHHTAF